MSGRESDCGGGLSRFRPSRGDDVELWIRQWRSRCSGDDWAVVNEMLDDYRLHADTGTPLGEKVREL